MAALPIYQVDAFTSQVLRGNPAAVVPLDAWLETETLQAIAGENNLSETAFLVRSDSGYHLRWFTPLVEVPLCGHATLASAFVVFNYLRPEWTSVTFESASGRLVVERRGDRLSMDFPNWKPEPIVTPEMLARGLGKMPVETHRAKYYLALYGTEDEVRALEPDFGLLKDPVHFGVIASAPGTDCDFVSRFFAPSVGINEDPVTGSAHCVLAPYWAERLGKSELHARQVSKRGGELFCRVTDDRVQIAGEAVLYLEGLIRVPIGA